MTRFFHGLQEYKIEYKDILEVWEHETSVVANPGLGLNEDPENLKKLIDRNNEIASYEEKIAAWRRENG